ncbi:unnamed protein product [Ectocarpus sp. 6 AP-2014]
MKEHVSAAGRALGDSFSLALFFFLSCSLLLHFIIARVNLLSVLLVALIVFVFVLLQPPSLAGGRPSKSVAPRRVFFIYLLPFYHVLNTSNLYRWKMRSSWVNWLKQYVDRKRIDVPLAWIENGWRRQI